VLHHEWAGWLAATGSDPAPVLRQGLARIDEALASRPQWAHAHAVRAGLLLALPETPAESPQWKARKSEARKELDQALANNPNLVGEWGHVVASRERTP
jgi:eukaryotic-like serine/threonine-protein kinase